MQFHSQDFKGTFDHRYHPHCCLQSSLVELSRHDYHVFMLLNLSIILLSTNIPPNMNIPASLPFGSWASNNRPRDLFVTIPLSTAAVLSTAACTIAAAAPDLVLESWQLDLRIFFTIITLASQARATSSGLEVVKKSGDELLRVAIGA